MKFTLLLGPLKGILCTIPTAIKKKKKKNTSAAVHTTQTLHKENSKIIYILR